MNDLLGLLSAFQSFRTTFCPPIYLKEKQNTQQQPQWQHRRERKKNQQAKPDFGSTTGITQPRAPQEQQNQGSSLSAELGLEVQLPCTYY